MVFRKYGDPRLLIILWTASNSPDCVTVASRSAKATSFLRMSNLELSPISLMMAAPVTLPISVMLVIGDSSFSIIPEISVFVAFTCFCIKEICSISVLSWKVKLFLAKVTPKELYVQSVFPMKPPQNRLAKKTGKGLL